MKTIKNIIFYLVLISIFQYGCDKDKDEHPVYPSSAFISQGSYTGDYWPTNGWRTCRPEEVGMDAELLKRVNDEILILQRLHADIHNVIILKNGYIVAEQYYANYTEDSLHSIYSCTKSITSALMGIAIEEGAVESINKKVLDFFPDYEVQNLTTEKQNISIEEMLTMSAGFEWYEMEYSYNDENNSFYQWVRSEDRIQFVLDLPLTSIPGEEYNYNTGISHVLSAIIQRTTGMRTDEYARDKLFHPLGISHYDWFIDPNEIATGGHGLKMSPRDMAKFGHLYLKDGKWEDEQIVPLNWVRESSTANIQRKYISDFHYGYHWWVKKEQYYSAVGVNGQWIYIVPEYELVVVFTNNINEEDYLQLTTPERLLNTYIIPAVLW